MNLSAINVCQLITCFGLFFVLDVTMKTIVFSKMKTNKKGCKKAIYRFAKLFISICKNGYDLDERKTTGGNNMAYDDYNNQPSSTITGISIFAEKSHIELNILLTS